MAILFSVLLIVGTLTQNEMVFKRLHLGTVSYGTDTMDEIQNHIIGSYAQVYISVVHFETNYFYCVFNCEEIRVLIES